MTTPSPPPQSFEERISQVRLWVLLVVLFVPSFAWRYLSLRLGVSDEVSRIVFDLVSYGFPFGWWILKAAPRPYSVQTTMGRSLDLEGWRLVAIAFFGVSCVQIIWWSIPYCPGIVKAVSGGGVFSLSGNSVTPEFFKILVPVVLAPIIEELLFRGTLFRKWRLRWGPGKALLVTSVIFGAYHKESLAAFLTGLTFALAYTRTRSLWAPLAIHALHNITLQALTVLSYLWDEPDLIYLDSLWEYALSALVLLVGAGLWVHFVVKSWPTLGDPLPPDSLQATAEASASSVPDPLHAAG